jgi:hypothetical protein
VPNSQQFRRLWHSVGFTLSRVLHVCETDEESGKSEVENVGEQLQQEEDGEEEEGGEEEEVPHCEEEVPEEPKIGVIPRRFSRRTKTKPIPPATSLFIFKSTNR